MRTFAFLLLICSLSLPATASLSEFNLVPGEYLLVVNYQISGNGQPPVTQTDRVVLSYSDGNLILQYSEQPEFTIAGEKAGNNIIAQLKDADGIVEFAGEMVADNHVSGQMSGFSAKQGDLSGSFELKHVVE